VRVLKNKPMPQKRKEKKTFFTLEKKILLISILIIIGLTALNFLNYLFTGNWNEFQGTMGPILIFSTLIIGIPQFFLRYQKYKVIRDYEDMFPVFLRDVIESLRSGMPFHKAIIHGSKLDYGKFSIEVRKMANQISWGMPFSKVIDQFIERVKTSKRISLASIAIRETYLSGGDVISTLESIAETNIMLQESEKEKAALLSQYVMLMYAIAFIFVGVVAAINKLMVPIFEASLAGASTGQGAFLVNPCSQISAELEYGVCDMLAGVARYALFIVDSPAAFYQSIGAYYTSLFFLMVLIQSACCGLVAGQISENSVMAGVKHSIIMLTVCMGTFYILIYLRILGV
jgi:flagellar protein FlaJ